MKLNSKFSINIRKDTNAIEKVLNKINSLYTDEFKKFMLDKVLQTLDLVIQQRSGLFSTDNDRYLYEYKENNKVEYTDNGFIVYNDTKVDIPSEYNSQSTISNYPEGKFNIAMAFEYGTGIVGLTNPVSGHWEYNVKDYNEGWIYRDALGSHHTFGSRGYEFYRYTAIEVNKNLNKWTKEYLERKGK